MTIEQRLEKAFAEDDAPTRLAREIVLLAERAWMEMATGHDGPRAIAWFKLRNAVLDHEDRRMLLREGREAVAEEK